jgi:hypothetical protein
MNFFSAWIMQYAKGASHLLNPFVHFFCVAQKKWTKEKGAAARCLSRQNFRTSFGGLRKSALIWCPTSSDVLGVFALIHLLLKCFAQFTLLNN